MAIPLRKHRMLVQPYTAGPLVWGTGVNDVHSVYGEGDPLRVTGRNQSGEPRTAPQDADQEATHQRDLWGYTDDDWSYLNPAPPRELMYPQASWDEGASGANPAAASASFPTQPQTTPSRRDNVAQGFPAWGNRPWRGNTIWRGHKAPNNVYTEGDVQNDAQNLPTETVSEGWLNKAVSGKVARSKPSDQSQLIVQTSQVQRFRERNNQHAVARATDDARAGIQSRVQPQKENVYSTGERLADMFPRQQDIILRPFWYRRAGTGPVEYLDPNAMFVSAPYERIPPSDPSLGIPEPATAQGDTYGYTAEDQFYA